MTGSDSDAIRGGATSQTFAKSTARQRITQVVESWFLTEPLLFAAWTMHDVVERSDVATIRVGRGKIEFNSEFIRSLRRDQLRSVLGFETMRILLGHPYARRQPNADLSYQASNLTVQECLRTKLPIARARDVFGDDSFDDQYFEYYYRELAERAHDEPDQDDQTPPSGQSEDEQGRSAASQNDDFDGDDDETSDEGGDANATNDLAAYCDPKQVGIENTSSWDEDDLQRDEINAAVREAAESDGWGTIAGNAKEQLLATLHPKLDYRGVLRNFRQSVLSVRRRLTRMKPSRRYGFAQMGSRYDFTTKLLFAVDVSGSMGRDDLRQGFSVISRFFRYGVESVDVIWFDEAIQGGPLTLRRARKSFEVTGRGGTNFKPVLDFIDANPGYDGLVVFTDGYAPVPAKPKNTRTRILWLFKDETTYQRMHDSLRPLGRSAFLQGSAR